MVESFVLAEGFPNLAIGVVKGGELVWHAGLGTGERPGTPPNESTLFAIGSVTKVFTATALLSLVEDEVLSLDDELAAWLPEIETVVAPAGSKAITLRHLLNHSSGLPRESTLRVDRAVTMTEEALLAALRGESLLYAPGTYQSYSNLALSLAGVVIARASGQSYQSFVQERVLDPLGMHASVFDTPASGAAPGHYANWRGGYFLSEDVWQLGAYDPVGGLYSSVKDLVGLVRHGLGKASVLSPEMLAQSQVPLRLNPRDVSYGLGWLITDHPELGRVVWHDGTTGDYATYVAALPAHDLGVIVLTGTAAFGDGVEVYSLGDAVLAYLLNPETQTVPEKSTTPLVLQNAVGDHILAFMADPTPELAQETFTPSLLQLVSAEELIGYFGEVAEVVGTCSSWETFEDRGHGALLLVFSCEYGPFPIFAMPDTAPPYRVDWITF